MNNIKDLLSGLTDEFCAEQLKEFVENSGTYQAEATNLIDDCAPPLRRFLFGLTKIMGIDSVVGADILLSMLIRFEARQEILEKQNSNRGGKKYGKE